MMSMDYLSYDINNKHILHMKNILQWLAKDCWRGERWQQGIQLEVPIKYDLELK